MIMALCGRLYVISNWGARDKGVSLNGGEYLLAQRWHRRNMSIERLNDGHLRKKGRSDVDKDFTM